MQERTFIRIDGEDGAYFVDCDAITMISPEGICTDTGDFLLLEQGGSTELMGLLRDMGLAVVRLRHGLLTDDTEDIDDDVDYEEAFDDAEE